MIDRKTTLYTALAVSGLTLLRYYWLGHYRRKLRHPPSPWSLPFVGNIFSIPPGLDYISYMELGRQLNSDLVYMNMMGQPLIILNSAEAASDLLEKHSANHSDRLSVAMVSDPTLLDWSGFVGMLPYSDLWRRQRRRMNEWLNVRAVRKFDVLQQDEARLLLGRLLDIPASPRLFEQVKHQLFFTTGSATFKLAYGYQFKSDQDPFFLSAVEVIEILFQATIPGNFLVNAFPILSYVPDWFPGTSWKDTARKWREQKNRAVDAPYEWTKQQVAAGNFEPSVLSALLQDQQLDSDLSDADREKELKELAFVLFLATGLVSFIAAMIVDPEAQAKAQAEIDSMLGYATRLPTASDEAQLPYVRNLILEVLRWQPIGPTGGPPHACYQDDVYRGYDIQKGTVFLGNVWAMSRNEAVYKDPETFNPDRFLDPNVPPVPGFGWGRRKCPGIHFAEMSLFVTISSLLTVFSFSRKKDVNGAEIIPTIEAAGNHFVLTLKPFEFELRPRSERHRQLIIESIPSK
ncbi:cytochrome P450 family protein [Rhizoctonia solani 123E]|uniref:Cytochrome P450 family protein n=1 Tax=Rhizoctonia solani 123E TaxID=1423351 RepID=A0A074RIM0_9AGAM|nr:cytochrome P450 family protein [Rhizoctonia solani 123E]